MKINKPDFRLRNGQNAFTIVEVLVAFLCGGLMIGVMIKGYALSAQRAEFASYSQAAQAMAMKQMEKVMSASWRPSAGLDQLVTNNFPVDTDYLSLPVTVTNLINCTNYTTITLLASNTATVGGLKMIQVDCVWSYVFYQGSQFTNLRSVYTSSVATIRGPSIGQ